MINFKAERETMIESQIRPNAVTQTELLKAMLTTPRELFVPPSQRSLAYMDGPLRVEAARDGQAPAICCRRWCSPSWSQLADVRPTDKVLDVGAATGYSTAISGAAGARGGRARMRCGAGRAGEGRAFSAGNRKRARGYRAAARWICGWKRRSR